MEHNRPTFCLVNALAVLRGVLTVCNDQLRLSESMNDVNMALLWPHYESFPDNHVGGGVSYLESVTFFASTVSSMTFPSGKLNCTVIEQKNVSPTPKLMPPRLALSRSYLVSCMATLKPTDISLCKYLACGLCLRVNRHGFHSYIAFPEKGFPPKNCADWRCVCWKWPQIWTPTGTRRDDETDGPVTGICSVRRSL